MTVPTTTASPAGSSGRSTQAGTLRCGPSIPCSPRGVTALLSRRALLGAGALLAGAGCSRPDPGPTPSPTLAEGVSVSEPTTPAPPAAPTTVPFLVNGEPVAQAPVQVGADLGGQAEPAPAEQLWAFGGDYTLIGSLPLEASTVFGSMTSNPEALMSYSAALISQGSSTPISPEVPATIAQADYYEPQDGAATDEWIVWRAANISTDSQAANTIDNWQLWAHERSTGRSFVVGSAAALNATDSTPASPREVMPTQGGAHVYFASSVGGQDQWERRVLCYELTEGAQPVTVGAGDYPAALEDGVLMAVPDAEGALLEVSRWSVADSTATRQFTIGSPEGDWQVGGLWARGEHRAVAVVSGTEGAGSYIGLWDEGAQAPAVWLHVSSSAVIGSPGLARFAWGSGSSATSAGMYVVSWDGSGVGLLGQAVGYSRPALSPAGDIALVPSTDGASPASWSVVSL